MTLLQTIKATSLQARKDRRTGDAATLQTLIGEAETIGKNAGNRETTDLELIAVIKKFIKNIDEVLSLVDNQSLAYANAFGEKNLLESFLPSQLGKLELELTINAIKVELCATTPKDMGKILKVLKERFEGQYDGTTASTIAKAVLT